MQLRMNRRGSSLPDSAADMWMQLVQAQEQDGRLFHGNKAAVQRRMREVLRLGGGDTFPAGRVVTLWRNDRWRSMITRWCRTEVGRGTFTNISTWEWMASLRIDNVSAATGAKASSGRISFHDGVKLTHSMDVILVLVFRLRRGPGGTALAALRWRRLRHQSGLGRVRKGTRRQGLRGIRSHGALLSRAR